MTQLFSHYSVSEIFIFTAILAIAIKSIIQFIDWARKRARQAVKQAQVPNELRESINKHEQQLTQLKDNIKDIKKSIKLLIESDKDDIKQSITRSHHYFCYKVGSIDDYSLDCMEKRYAHYKDEGGNSFIKALMQEVRALPRKLDKEKWQ